MATGNAAREHAVPILLTVVSALGLGAWALRRDGTRRQVQGLTLRSPVLGPLWIRYQVAQLARLLSTLLTGGVPLVAALETAGTSVGTGVLQDTLRTVQERVREGQGLSLSIARAGIFPKLAIEMVKVGEATGALPQMLTSVAEFFDEEVQTKTTALLSLIEPVIMIFMGIFVALVLISLYLPILSLAEQF